MEVAGSRNPRDMTDPERDDECLQGMENPSSSVCLLRRTEAQTVPESAFSRVVYVPISAPEEFKIIRLNTCGFLIELA